MRELAHILTTYRDHSPQPCVLGTLVDLHGSGYRRPGARVLIMPDGARAGLISGGCLEREVARQASALTHAGPALAIYDTRSDTLHPRGRYGTGCDGIVTLLLERLPAATRLDPLEHIYSAHAAGDALVMATITHVQQPHARLLAARMILGARDHIMADACFPDPSRPHILQAMREVWHTQRALMLECDEGMHIFIEHLAPPRDLLIFGDGDDVRPLVALASTLGWRARVVGKWPARATRARFPHAHSVHLASDHLLPSLPITPHTHAVVMTHDFDWDAQLVPLLLQTPARSVGLLGPRRRALNLIQHWRLAGTMPALDALERLHTPLGLDLGAEAPEEVALSILSAITASAHGHEGGLLSRSQGPIHGTLERRPLSLHPAKEEAS